MFHEPQTWSTSETFPGFPRQYSIQKICRNLDEQISKKRLEMSDVSSCLVIIRSLPKDMES